MSLTEKAPDVSTISQNRIRRFNHSDVFQQIFYLFVEQALTFVWKLVGFSTLIART
jgi:hypothetical protein